MTGIEEKVHILSFIHKHFLSAYEVLNRARYLIDLEEQRKINQER